MTVMDHYTPVIEVTADSRARIPIGKAGAHQNDRYLVYTSDDGNILLTPVESVPKRELLIWENDSVRESLMRGAAQASAGQTRRRDDLLDEDDD